MPSLAPQSRPGIDDNELFAIVQKTHVRFTVESRESCPDETFPVRLEVLTEQEHRARLLSAFSQPEQRSQGPLPPPFAPLHFKGWCVLPEIPLKAPSSRPSPSFLYISQPVPPSPQIHN